MKTLHSNHNSTLAAVLSAVQECRSKPLGDPQRIIVLLAAPGFGVPRSFCHALRQHGAVLLPGVPMDKGRVRLLKLLAHRTRVVPLLLTSAEDWRCWNRRQPLAAAQIRRRTVMVVELDAPTPGNN